MKVSVVITNYNYGNFIKEAINSVLGQTFTDYEIIIVDDGSTDNSDEIIKPFLSNTKIKYIKQQNAGQANAKNTGIKNSKGEFIAFLDADDFWEPIKLEMQLPLFKNVNLAVVYSSMYTVDRSNNVFQPTQSNKYFKFRRGRIINYLVFDNFIPFSSSVVRKSVLDEMGIFNEEYSMGIDWDLWLRISTKYEFDYCDKPLLNYRVGHSGQMSKNLKQRLKNADDIFKNFLKNNHNCIPEKVYNKVLVYNYLNRANYFRKMDMQLSESYLKKVLKIDIFSISAIKLLIKNYLNINKYE